MYVRNGGGGRASVIHISSPHLWTVFLVRQFFVLHYGSPPPYETQMDLKLLSNLSIRDRGPNGLPKRLTLNSTNASPDRYLEKLKNYAKSLPYSIEDNSKMQEMLDFVCLRLCQCVEAKDFDPGFAQWDSMIT